MYDIAFISYDEKNAGINFLKLISHATKNRVYRIHGIKGIHQAHIEAAKQSTTSMFYVVDADATILPNFKFNINLDPSEEDIVHVWRSRNPVNNLEYGYGGVKLLPTQLTLNMNLANPDMTTSISSRFKVMADVSNITQFNVDPMSTWRSAFRECAKLASRVITDQYDKETQERLNAWRFNQSHASFAEYARGGASAGEWFGKTYKADKKMLAKINDYNWLTSEYYGHIEQYPPETFKK